MESDELSAFNNAQQLSFKFDLAKIKAAHFLTEPLPTTMMQYDLTQKCNDANMCQRRNDYMVTDS